MGHHALLSGHTCPVQQGRVSRLAHGHAEPPLLAGEVGKLRGGLLLFCRFLRCRLGAWALRGWFSLTGQYWRLLLGFSEGMILDKSNSGIPIGLGQDYLTHSFITDATPGRPQVDMSPMRLCGQLHLCPSGAAGVGVGPGDRFLKYKW